MIVILGVVSPDLWYGLGVDHAYPYTRGCHVRCHVTREVPMFRRIVTQVTLFLGVTVWPFNFSICIVLQNSTDSRVFHPYQYDLSDKNSFGKRQHWTTPN